MFEPHQVLQRLRRNLGAYSFGYVITLLNQLVLLPVYLHYWPKEIYGEWLVLVALAVYVEMADFGLGVVTSNRMCMATAQGDPATATRVLHTTWTFQSGLLILLFVVLTGAIAWGNPSFWLGLRYLPPHEVKVATFLLMVRALIPCQLRLYAGVYACHFKAARGILIDNLARVGDLVMCIVMVVSGAGVVGLAASMLGVYAAAMALMQWDMARSCPDVRLGWKGFRLAELKACLRDGFAFQLIPTSGLFLMQGMTLVVNYALGPVAVVVYNTTRAVSRASLAAVLMASWAIRPELALLFGKGDLPGVRRIFRLLTRVSFWMSVAACLGILLLGHWGIGLLTHGKVDASGWFLALFAASVVTSGFWNGTSILLVGANRHRNFAIVTFAAVLLLLPLSFGLMRAVGLVGAPLALLAIDLGICFQSWRECRKVFRAEGVEPVTLLDTLLRK